ncbi:MAG: hypothetical protein JO301_08150 [Chitinophagaceae bacterium]|nr:hypothetical protein [Chitinophagaceae bacterium]
MTIQNPLLYLDPGSGSLLFQVILSAMLTAAVFFKKSIHFFRHLFAGFRMYRHKKRAE